MSVYGNLIDQELDIGGSLSVDNTRDLDVDEANFLGELQSTGTGDTIGGTAPDMTLTDAGASFTDQDIGRFIRISGATTGANDGVFLITDVTSGTALSYVNASGVAEAYAGTWEIRRPYSLLDEMDFHRTDRRNIKGTASHVTDVPIYQRPDANTTDVPANLTNISGNTLDAKALVVNRKHEDAAVSEGDTLVTLSSVSNLQHAGAVNTLGVPVFDGADAGNHLSTFVEIVDPDTGTALTVYGYAVGEIDADSGGTAVLPADTETFTLDDGTNPAVIFEFDDNATATNVAVDISAAADDDDVRDAMILAINNQRTLGNLNIFAEIGGPGLVQLTNDNPGTAGNVAITETVAAAGFTVTGMSGGTANAGERVFGRTQAGGSTSPDSVEVEFRSVPIGDDISTSNAYTWERDQPAVIDVFYGFRVRMDQMAETALRTTLVNGIIGDANLAGDLADIRAAVGLNDGDTSLFGKLTNIGNFYVFSTLDSDPTVVEALNALNAQIGDRDYSATAITNIAGLADGQTITESIEALALAIGSSTVTRVIERLAAAVSKNTAHTLPGGNMYTLDGTDNGQNMWVFWRKQLQDPGPVSGHNDYEETSTTQITPYVNLKVNDHVNYMIFN